MSKLLFTVVWDKGWVAGDRHRGENGEGVLGWYSAEPAWTRVRVWNTADPSGCEGKDEASRGDGNVVGGGGISYV
ncbi:hypothetical protein HPP92_004246 [Vanilla planifolia]|uniref:Uncharacterized protein n=1 Tax=Vanilla planifolia TaxID=51239 RepID=A0A835VC43_VANPL|nr:hypothetical protein HPP92_004246 [Vanilla planifolia]